MSAADAAATRHDRRVVAEYERTHQRRSTDGPIAREEIETFERLTTEQLGLLVAHLSLTGSNRSPGGRGLAVRAVRAISRGLLGRFGSSAERGWATSAADAATLYPFMWGFGYWV